MYAVSGAEGRFSEGLPRWDWATAGRLWAKENGGSQGSYVYATGLEEN